MDNSIFEESQQMRHRLVILYKQFETERHEYKLRLYEAINGMTLKMQFIHLMNDWAIQNRQSILSFRYIANGGDSNHLNLKQKMQLPLGLWIQSLVTHKWYLNQGVCSKTLQGFMYLGNQWNDQYIEKVRNANGDFSVLLLEVPNVAMKYYDKTSVDECTTLNNRSKIAENAILEMEMLDTICSKLHNKNDELNNNNNNNSESNNNNNSILEWLPSPKFNIIRLVDRWLDSKRNCYFMITEYANCGELLVLTDTFHRNVYQVRNNYIHSQRLLNPDSLQQIRNNLIMSEDGENAYIEFVRYLFQSMVQAVYALHSQGICHLDLSMENWVIHFNEQGILTVKLIDFGRAKQFPIKTTNVRNPNPNPDPHGIDTQNTDTDTNARSTSTTHTSFEYDFSYNVFPGKCRYMSPEAAMCLKYRNCVYNANEQDIWSLAIVLYCMLTCSLPYNKPFAVVQNTAPNCLNGDRNYLIREKDFTDLDLNFEKILNFGIESFIYEQCFVDYVTPQSLDVLERCLRFDGRDDDDDDGGCGCGVKRILNIEELMECEFVQTKPDPMKLVFILQSLIDCKKKEFESTSLMKSERNKNSKSLYNQRFIIKAKESLLMEALEQERMEQQMNDLWNFNNNNNNTNNSLDSERKLEDDLNAIMPLIPTTLDMMTEKEKNNIINGRRTTNDTENDNARIEQMRMREEYRELLSAITTDVLVLNKLNALNLEINVTQFLASPSPPPCAMYCHSEQFSETNTLNIEDISDYSSENDNDDDNDNHVDHDDDINVTTPNFNNTHNNNKNGHSRHVASHIKRHFVPPDTITEQ